MAEKVTDAEALKAAEAQKAAEAKKLADLEAAKLEAAEKAKAAEAAIAASKAAADALAAAAAAVPAAQEAAARATRLDSLCTNHVLAALGVGLIPIPVVDLLGVSAVQIDLINKLSSEYKVPFTQDLGKSILASLMAGLFPSAVGGTVVSLLKFIPVVGSVAGAVTMPVLAGAATYAVHKVFVQHYESGGTLLDLDPAKVKKYFAEQFASGKLVAADLLKSSSPKKAG